MKSGNGLLKASMVFNVIILVTNVLSVAAMVWAGGTGNMDTGNGLTPFRYFTVDSNILAAIAAIVILPHLSRAIKTGAPLPKGVVILKHAGASAVAVTFFTVVFFLGPNMGYLPMFAGINLILHGTSPLLAMISSIFLEAKASPRMSFKASLFGWLPLVIYGVFYVVLAIFIGEGNGGWPDFYGFNAGGMWYIAYPVMMVAGLALSSIIWALQNKFRGKK